MTKARFPHPIAARLAALLLFLATAGASSASTSETVVAIASVSTADTTAVQRLRDDVRQRAENVMDSVESRAERIEERLAAKGERALEKGRKAKRVADWLLDTWRARVTTDTLWVARPQCTWTFKAKTDLLGDIIHLHTGELSKHGVSDYYLTARPKMTLGVSANYKGLSLALSFSPTNMLRDMSDFVSSLNYYSNRYGIDLSLERIDEFKGHSELLGERERLDKTTLRSFAASAYYVFNGRRFSYPAVFNSSWEQRRSAGSFIVQANFDWGRLRIGNQQQYDVLHRLDTRSLSLGAGYGYNLVLPPHWLIHLTVLPSIMLWKDYRIYMTDEEGDGLSERMHSKHLNIHLTARIGATYSWSRFFVGATGIVHSVRTGLDDGISMSDTRWKTRAFFGVRL